MYSTCQSWSNKSFVSFIHILYIYDFLIQHEFMRKLFPFKGNYKIYDTFFMLIIFVYSLVLNFSSKYIALRLETISSRKCNKCL